MSQLSKKKITKSQLVGLVAEKITLSKKESEEVINITFESIIDALKNGDKVELRGFGSFRIRHRESRVGRNPKTGETVEVPAKKIPFFKVGKRLKGMVNDKKIIKHFKNFE